MKSAKSNILCLGKKRLLRRIQQYNELNKVIKKMDTILINSKNSGTSDAHRLFLNLSVSDE